MILKRMVIMVLDVRAFCSCMSIEMLDVFMVSRALTLEAQQQHFSYRAILVAIVSQNSVVLAFMLSGLPNANAKSPRFSYAIKKKNATLPPVVALNRSSKSQIAARHAAFCHAISQIALASFL